MKKPRSAERHGSHCGIAKIERVSGPGYVTPPTHIGVLVGCELPPMGSSVTASACVSDIASGGFSIIAVNLPSASGQKVMEGIALPDFFDISQSCKVRLSPGFGVFQPRTTRPMS